MKIKTKKIYLLGILLSTFLIIGIINITNGAPITISIPTNSDLHNTSIFSLFLGNDDSDSAQIKVTTGGNNLDILNGLFVSNRNDQQGNLSTVGGGLDNVIKNNNAGIAGGKSNFVGGENGAIGGGDSNRVEGKNGVVVGGYRNTAGVLGVVLGGTGNESSGGIVLGGSDNKAYLNSLALGQHARGDNYSFAWNGWAPEFSARINASSGMLIGTYHPVIGVSLVVSGAIKLGDNTSNNTGSIYISSGCIKFYDGKTYNTLGKTSESSILCGISTGCQFGETVLHNGDIIAAYSGIYAPNCEDIKQIITCKNGQMTDNSGGTTTYIYPYCYNLSNNPIIDIDSGYQNCTGLPENAEWLNPYFTQRKIGGTYTPSSKTGHYSTNPNEECSFICKDKYVLESGNCVKPVAYLEIGHKIHSNMLQIAGSSSNIEHFVMYTGNSISSGVITEKISTDDSPTEVVIWYDNDSKTIYYYTEAEKIYLNENSRSIFSNLYKLTSLDLSNWDTSKVIHMGDPYPGSNSPAYRGMFEGCSSLTSLDLSSWDTSNVHRMGNMFKRCSSLTNLNIGGWDTSNVTDMHGMFEGCQSLTGLDVSNWNTSKVTYMNSMFNNCSNLTSLDISNRDTNNVLIMSNMFDGCSSLRNITFGNNWNTSKVTSMSQMFKNCSSLTGLDISNWNTSLVTDMNSMFNNCTNLTSLDIGNWNTSSVTDMNSMFNGCSNLTSLNLSNWNTSSVTDMNFMFNNCTNLKTIYASNHFSTNNLNTSISSSMFENSENLIGGNGTTYDGSHIDKDYARIDRPGQPGYFTWYCKGDINHDNLIDEDDYEDMSTCIGTNCYRKDYDFNNDSHVDGADLEYISNQMDAGATCN